MTRMFVVIEGIDLIGKTAQHEMLCKHLRDRGRDVVAYSFPMYDSPTGEVIGNHLRGRVAACDLSVAAMTGVRTVPRRSAHDALVFQCLQVVDKYALVPEIMEHRRAGRTIVLCRWWQSSLVYGSESVDDGDWVRRTCARLPRADVNILLDLDPSKARRRPGSQPDRLEADLAMQSRLRQRYLDLWRKQDSECGFWGIVDAEGLAEDVHGRVVSQLASYEKMLGRVETWNAF